MTLLAAAVSTTTTTTTTSWPGPTSPPYNVATHLATPTYDGSGNTVHPDIIDFQTSHGLASWNGYRFWMLHTPFPNSQSEYENPSILVSHDGVTWTTPSGLTNPLYDTPSTGWNSDTDLVYDPDTDEVIAIFRDENYDPQVARSSDGVTWPATPTAPTWTLIGSQGASPSAVRIASGEWHIWQVVKDAAQSAGGPRSVWRWVTTAPDSGWGTPTQCTGFPANSLANPTVWHCDVIQHDGQFWMLAQEAREDENPSAFHLASSTDGINWAYGASPVITEGSGNWDNTQLYRGTLQPHENGTHMRVWYCGNKVRFGGPVDSWHVGLTLIPLSEWPAPP